jgi:hypothetical protein
MVLHHNVSEPCCLSGFKNNIIQLLFCVSKLLILVQPKNISVNMPTLWDVKEPLMLFFKNLILFSLNLRS